MPQRKCKGTNEAGEPCESPVVGQDGFCPAHGPKGRERMSERGRKGGAALARKYSAGKLDPDELPPLEDAHAAETWCDVVGRAVVTGRLSHNQGRAALRAVREWRESHKSGAVSEKLEDLMEALASWRETGDPKPVLELVDGGET